MKLTIKKQKENPVLRRTELEAELVFTGATPSRDAVSNDVASQMKTKPEFIDVKNIKSTFGQQLGKALVYVYKDVASKKEMVKSNKKKAEKAKKAEEAKGSK
jgi:small subunit ribosomal protein S24e